MPSKFVQANGGTCALILALISSLSLNIVLATKLRRPVVLPPAGIQANLKMPMTVSVLDQGGKPASLTFGTDPRPTVLYVLSPNCGWCKRNEANVRSLYSAANSRFRFVGLSIDKNNLSEYLAGKHVPFPVYLATSEEQKKELDLYGTPQTAVITSDGRVQRSWQGAYVGTSVQEIEEYFGVKLPGLQQITANPRTSH